jgi:hypothetical protein
MNDPDIAKLALCNLFRRIPVEHAGLIAGVRLRAR